MTQPQDPAFREVLRRAHRTAVFAGSAMISALAVYLLAEEIIRGRFRPFAGFAPVGNRLSLRYAFYAAAAAVVVVLRLVNAALLRSRASKGPSVILQRLARANIVTLVLAEVPAVLGLVLFLLGGFNRDFYALLFVSLVLEFMYFPRLRTWEAYLQNAPPACRFSG